MVRLLACLLVVSAIGCSAVDSAGKRGPSGEPDAPGDPIYVYCSYGAVSRAQLDGCVTHVTEQDYLGRDTNAARYARGELSTCRADAGPFCEGR